MLMPEEVFSGVPRFFAVCYKIIIPLLLVLVFLTEIKKVDLAKPFRKLSDSVQVKVEEAEDEDSAQEDETEPEDDEEQMTADEEQEKTDDTQ